MTDVHELVQRLRVLASELGTISLNVHQDGSGNLERNYGVTVFVFVNPDGCEKELRQLERDNGITWNNGWIPVTERLPEVGQEVIVAVYRTGGNKAIRRTGCLEYYDGTFSAWSVNGDKQGYVTHWQPLSELPEETE